MRRALLTACGEPHASVFVVWHQTALLVPRVDAAALTENLNQAQSVELSSKLPATTPKFEASVCPRLPKTPLYVINETDGIATLLRIVICHSEPLLGNGRKTNDCQSIF
jgi:hypothetical protein